MVKFLSWNLNKAPLSRAVADLVHEHDIDVVVLSECAVDSRAELIPALGEKGQAFSVVENLIPMCDIEIYTRFNARFIAPKVQDAHWHFCTFSVPPLPEQFLLVAVHLVSKRETDPKDQYALACQFGAMIRE